MNRRNFLRLGALFVPLAAEPVRAYSFLWAPAGATYVDHVHLTAMGVRLYVSALLKAYVKAGIISPATALVTFDRTFAAALRTGTNPIACPEGTFRGTPGRDPYSKPGT